MSNNIVIRIVVFGTLAILSIIAAQTWWVTNIWDLKEEEFHEKVNIALLNVAGEFEKLGRNLPEYDLINQVSPNFYVVNVNDNINASNLEYFLRSEMETVGLTEEFQYGIYNCTNKNMVWGELITYQPNADTTNVKREGLPVYDDENFEYYFGVTFPNRGNWILNNMRPTLFLTFILLITSLFFMYSMFVILRQKRLSEMQKDFINNMTHEFKTPISTIKISADTFLNNPKIKNDPRLTQYARIIRDQNIRLNNQVEKVLQIAKIEQDNFKLNKEEIVLQAFLLKILNGTQLNIEALNGTFSTDLNTPDLIIKADRLHLNNILHNLLDNATKYSKEKPDVQVRTYKKGRKIHLEIKDAGIGISKEEQTKIFKKFYRVPTGNVHNVKGFGLGLFYVKNICRSHGWKVELESEEGKGTTIRIVM
ncbi:MAG: two-component system phosphate regulon sensor histidine kinase PhoR [Saprospiraceae bacterium]